MEYRAEAATAGTSYYTRDHLGSTRLETNAAGQQGKYSDFLPFGEEIAAGTGGRPACFNANDNKVKFTGKERNAETGLDYFMARYFSSAQGRFTSPDPLLASARLTDPQTWNRYAYVRNDPVNMIDPDGRAVIDPSVYQFYQSQFWTGNEFNAWFNQAMSNNTMADYNAMLASYNLATIPGYSAPDPTFVAYLDIVDWGQANLYVEEQRKADTKENGPAGRNFGKIPPPGPDPLIYVERMYTKGNTTIGTYTVLSGRKDEWKSGYVLERTATLMPVGEYPLYPHSARNWQNTVGVKIGDNHSGVLWHTGNTFHDATGCFIPGYGLGADGISVTSSYAAMMDILRLTGARGRQIITDHRIHP
jgi:RHS repeat-associated protein